MDTESFSYFAKTTPKDFVFSKEKNEKRILNQNKCNQAEIQIRNGAFFFFKIMPRGHQTMPVCWSYKCTSAKHTRKRKGKELMLLYTRISFSLKRSWRVFMAGLKLQIRTKVVSINEIPVTKLLEEGDNYSYQYSINLHIEA